MYSQNISCIRYTTDVCQDYAKLNSFKAVCIIVSLTAQNTSFMFSVSEGSTPSMQSVQQFPKLKANKKQKSTYFKIKSCRI